LQKVGFPTVYLWGKIRGPTPVVEELVQEENLAPDSAKALRADGRRNRELLLAAATELIGRDGAQASLEEIARRAGVGSATLHRHFASRRALLEAVFRDGVAQLCERATAQPDAAPTAALAAWLEDLTVYSATNRGLAAALIAGPDGLTAKEICCTNMVREVLDVLVVRASSAGALHENATTDDLMLLANSIAVATENDPSSARRLLRLALSGILR
jgi:AcrR family transcriptional regulator